MAKNNASPSVSDKVRRGCFPAARIYCVEKSFCFLPAHIALTARCDKADGAVSNLCYGFNVEDDAPNFTLVHVGNDNSVNTSLHNFVYWIHGYEHLDTVLNTEWNDIPTDVHHMCRQTAVDLDCNDELLVKFTRQDHNDFVDYLFSEAVFGVKKEDYILFVVSTTYNVMHLYHGNMKVCPRTKKSVAFGESNSLGTGMSVDLYNGAMMLDSFDEGHDPLDIPETVREGSIWAKSDVLSRLIHEAYVCVHAAAFNMLDDINGCRRLLLLLGQASTYKERMSKLKEYKYHDMVGNHKESVAKDMVDRCSLSSYLGIVESYSECSPTAYYKNWALKNSKDKARLMAITQKAEMAPMLFQAFTNSNAVGIGFRSILKTQQEISNEKAFIDRKPKDMDKEQKKLSKDLNQFKIQPGQSLCLPTAQRIIVASGFSPHLSQFTFQVLGFLNDSKRKGNEEAQYRSSACHFCNGDMDHCFCRALPKNIATACMMSAYGNADSKISGIVLLSNKPQAFADLEQPPFNMNASDEDLDLNRKLKPSNLVNEALSKLPDDAKDVLDKILEDPFGEVCSIVSRVEKLQSYIQHEENVNRSDKSSVETSHQRRIEKDVVDYKQVLSALKALYNVVHEHALKYCSNAEDAMRLKKGQQITPKHLFQTSSFLPSYAPYGPMGVVCALRSMAYFAYVTVHTFICSEIFKNPAMQMSKLVDNNELFNPNISSIAKGYMGKNHTLKMDLNIGVTDNQSFLKINESGECLEIQCNHLQTTNSMKPISLKRLLFSSSLWDDDKNYHRIGLTLLGDDTSKLFSGADAPDLFSCVNNDSTNLGVVMMNKTNIGNSAADEEKDVLKEYLPIFVEHDSSNANAFFHKVFSHSQREIRMRVAMSRGAQIGKRLQKLVQLCIEEGLFTNREQVICLAKYAWLFGRGRKTFTNGSCPIDCEDLAHCMFENFVSSTANVKNNGFPLESMNKIMPLVINPQVKRNLLTPVLTATLSSGYSLQSNPLVMGTLTSFAFSSTLGTILRCGLAGLNTSLLNKMPKANVDDCCGMADATRNYVMVLPNKNNFIQSRHDTVDKGLRPDELCAIRDKLELSYTEEMAIKSLLEFLNVSDFDKKEDAISEMRNLLDQHCDLFDEDVILNNVLKRVKKVWMDEDTVKKQKLEID